MTDDNEHDDRIKFDPSLLTSGSATTNRGCANTDYITDDGPLTDERRHNINESQDKIRLEIDLTRGTGTRDQEKHKLKARGTTPEEAAIYLSEALSELEDRDVFDRARRVGENDD